MKVEDAEILFKSKINWCAVYSENKIYCVEPGCNYFTTIDNEELKHHMKDVHGYGDYPCNYDHCDYVACSKVRLIENISGCLKKFFKKILKKFKIQHSEAFNIP